MSLWPGFLLCMGPEVYELKIKRKIKCMDETKDDVAKGHHRDSDMKELQTLSFFDLKVLRPIGYVRLLLIFYTSYTFTAGWRRTLKGEEDC